MAIGSVQQSLYKRVWPGLARFSAHRGGGAQLELREVQRN